MSHLLAGQRQQGCGLWRESIIHGVGLYALTNRVSFDVVCILEIIGVVLQICIIWSYL
jgi:hypothetical protein